AGSPPRWLREGIGTYLASRVEPRSSYYQHLRKTAMANYQQGWSTKANDALGEGGQIASEDLHAIGFALVESMLTSELRQGFPAFVNGMLQGPAKLDEMLDKVYNKAQRDGFLEDTGEWVAEHYGDLQ